MAGLRPHAGLMDERFKTLHEFFQSLHGEGGKILLGGFASCLVVGLMAALTGAPGLLALCLPVPVGTLIWLRNRGRDIEETFAAIPPADVDQLQERVATLEELVKRQQGELAAQDTKLGRLAAAVKERSLTDLAENFGLSMRNVISYTESLVTLLMDKMGSDPTFKGWVTRLDRELEPVSSFCESALTLAAAGKSNARKVELNSLVLRTTSLLGARLAQLGVELKLELAEGLPYVKSPPYRLAVVILDILGNCIDALEGRRAGRITLTTRERDGGVVLEISDSRAVGRTNVSRLFSSTVLLPDRRIEGRYGYSVASTVLKEEGVELDLSVDEEANTTTVRLFFPVAGTDLPEAAFLRLQGQKLLAAMGVAVRGHLDAPLPQERSSFKGLKVMVVDEDRVITNLCGDALESEGALVERVHDVKKGRQALVSGRFDLIITDYMMSGMDTRALIERLTYNRKAANRVIFMEGRDADPDFRQFLREFKFPFLEKPFTADQLVDLARDVLDRAQDRPT